MLWNDGSVVEDKKVGMMVVGDADREVFCIGLLNALLIERWS